MQHSNKVDKITKSQYQHKKAGYKDAGSYDADNYTSQFRSNYQGRANKSKSKRKVHYTKNSNH